MAPTVLITGFGPFPGVPVNPTETLVERLVKAARRRGIRCVGHVFATRYGTVDRELPALLARHRPDVLLMFGLAARRQHVCIEMYARNRMSTRAPDAGGFLPHAAAIAPDAPARLRGRAPFARLLAATHLARVKTRLSSDAGSYLCNYLYWQALDRAAKPGGPRVAVFVHVPEVRLPRRSAGRRTLFTIDRLVRAATAVLSVVVTAGR